MWQKAKELKYLENIYGAGDGELAEYLWGQASSEVTTNQFIGIGVITLFIAIFVFVAYYYVLGQLFRRPSWGNRWTWIVALLVNSFLAFIAGWQWTCSDLLAGKMKTIDAVTNLFRDSSKLPSWWQPVNLGLDLQGGSSLLLEVKVDDVIRERIIADTLLAFIITLPYFVIFIAGPFSSL